MQITTCALGLEAIQVNARAILLGGHVRTGIEDNLWYQYGVMRLAMVDFSLQGKVALVTGASRGISAGIALELATHGATVAMTARQRASLADVCQRIEALGQRVLPVALEATNVANIQAAIAQVEQVFDAIDILVNNAGTNIPRPAMEVTEAQQDRILDINLKGVFFCAPAVAKRRLNANAARSSISRRRRDHRTRGV